MPKFDSNGRSRRIAVTEEWLINPRCRICGKVTRISQTSSGILDHDIATYGHLYSHWDLRRYLRGRKIKKWQLECFKCNNGKEKSENPNWDYRNKYGSDDREAFPELLIALAEEKENEIFLTQIEFK